MSCVVVPAKMTHVFQPADMFVISCLKSHAQRSWLNWVEHTIATATTIEAGVDECIVIGNATVKKQMKYKFLSNALTALGTHEGIVASWEASGILRAIGVQPRLKHNGELKQSILFDAYKELAVLEAEVTEAEVAEREDENGQKLSPEPVAPKKLPAKAAQKPHDQPAKKGPGRPKAPPPKPATGKASLFHYMPKRPREETPVVEERLVVHEAEPEAAQQCSSSDGEV